MLLPAKYLLSTTYQCLLDFDQTMEFMTKVNGVSDILAQVKSLLDTSDIEGVLNLRFHISKMATHKSIKNKCVRIIILLTETRLTPVIPDRLVNLNTSRLFRKDRICRKWSLYIFCRPSAVKLSWLVYFIQLYRHWNLILYNF